MSGFKSLSQNFSLNPDDLFHLAVQALEVPGDWSLQKVEEDKHYASATTRAKFPAAPHVVQIIVQPARGRHTRELSTLIVKSRPKFGLGGGMDFGGVGADNVQFIMNQVITFVNSLAQPQP